ncbi:MAG TPA: hypothetical protein VJ768_00395, partial [Anaerolineales bacterium]|nr:hypothetical protein [Anaerolineales bacterium]
MVKAGAFFGLAGVILLVTMAVVGIGAGETLGVLEQPDLDPPYAAAIRPGADSILVLMALDTLFLVAYSGAFLGAAAAVWKKAAIWGAAGLGFALLTTVLDLSENALTVNIARKALADQEISSGLLTAVNALGYVKYGSASVATAFFAAALLVSMPASPRLTRATAALLLLFGVVNAITIAVPAAGLLLVLWMLVVLTASTVLLFNIARKGD